MVTYIFEELQVKQYSKPWHQDSPPTRPRLVPTQTVPSLYEELVLKSSILTIRYLYLLQHFQ